MADKKKSDLSSNELINLFDEAMKELQEERDTDEAVEREFENEERKTKKTNAIEFWKEIFADSDPFNEVTTSVLEEKTKPIQETAKHFWLELEDETHKIEKYDDLNKNFREILEIAEKEKKNVEAKKTKDKAVPYKILTRSREMKQIPSLKNNAKTGTKQKSDIVHKKIKYNDAINPNIPEILPFNQEAEENKIVKKKRINRFHEHQAVINNWAVFVDEVLKEQEVDAQRQQKNGTGGEILVKDRLKVEAVNIEDEKHIKLAKCVEEDYQREQMELENLDAVAETKAAEQIGIEEVLQEIDTIQQKKKMLYSNFNKRKMLSRKRRELFRNLSPIPEKLLSVSKIDKCVQTDSNMTSTSTEPIYYIQQYENGKTVLICNKDNTTEIDTRSLQSGTAEKHSTTQSVKKNNKSETKKTKINISGKMININKPTLNNDTKNKPDKIRCISNEFNKMDIKNDSIIEDKKLKSDETIHQNVEKTMDKAEKENDNTAVSQEILTQTQEHTVYTPIPDNQDTKDYQADTAKLLKRLQKQEAVLNEWAVLIDDVQKKHDFEMQQKFDDTTKCNKNSSDNIDEKKKISTKQIDKTQNKPDNTKKKIDKRNKTHSSLNNDGKEKSENNGTSESTEMVIIKMDAKQKLHIVDEILKSEEINLNSQERRQIVDKVKKNLEGELINNKSIPHEDLEEEFLNSSLLSLNDDNSEDNNIKKKRNRKKNKTKPKTMDLTAYSENTSEKTLVLNFPASNRDKESTPNSMLWKIMDKDDKESAFTLISTSTDNAASNTLDTHFSNLQNDKKEVRAYDVNETLHRPKEDTAYLIPSSGNSSNKTLVVNVPKFENDNVRIPDSYLQQSKDGRMVLVTCKKDSTNKTTEINNPVTKTDQTTRNKPNNTQKNVQSIPDKTLKIYNSSLNNDSKQKPENIMKNEEKNPIQSLKKHEDGRKVLITCKKASTGKTTESVMPIFQTENRTETKTDNKQTTKYIPDETMNTTKSSLNNNTTETKPDYNKQQKGIEQNASKNDNKENKSNDNSKNKNKRRNRRKSNK